MLPPHFTVRAATSIASSTSQECCFDLDLKDFFTRLTRFMSKTLRMLPFQQEFGSLSL